MGRRLAWTEKDYCVELTRTDWEMSERISRRVEMVREAVGGTYRDFFVLGDQREMER